MSAMQHECAPFRFPSEDLEKCGIIEINREMNENDDNFVLYPRDGRQYGNRASCSRRATSGTGECINLLSCVGDIHNIVFTVDFVAPILRFLHTHGQLDISLVSVFYVGMAQGRKSEEGS